MRIILWYREGHRRVYRDIPAGECSRPLAGGPEHRAAVAKCERTDMDAPYSDGAISDEFFDSMEQLWLAFVMKKKYGKVWNGEEWEVDH